MARFPASHGDMAARIRDHDWSTTPLGAIGTWPAALKVTVDTILSSDFPQCLMWGPDLIAIPNDAFVPILGDKPDALGQPWLDIWSEIRGDIAPILDRALAGEATFIEDFHVRVDRYGAPDDAWFTFCYSPVRDADGTVRGVIDTVVETTGKVRTTHAHAANEARLNLMLGLLQSQRETDDPAEMMAQACRAVAGYLKANRAGFYEVEHEDTVVFTQSYGDGVLAPLDGTWPAERLGRHYLGALRAGDTICVADTWSDSRTADSRFDLIGARATIGSPVLREGRWVAGMYVNHASPRAWRPEDVAMVRDIVQHTWDSIERARSARMVREMNERLERQVEERTSQLDRVWRNSLDIQAVLTPDGMFRALNPAWRVILGRRPADAVGRLFTEFVWPDDVEKTLDWLASPPAGTTISFETRLVHADGTPRWLAWRMSAEGETVYAYGRDITAKKEQAEALRRTEDALRQAQKMEAVGQLTGGIAHDFNNMLAVITGSLDLLARRVTADERAKGFVASAAEAARRAAGLTQRLLAFSRSQPLQPEALDVNLLISGMTDLICRSLGTGIQLDTDLDRDLWIVHADPNQLENVLVNLGVNARDAMPDGGRLTILTRNAGPGCPVTAAAGIPSAEWVRVAVRDAGCGMPREVMAKAFDPFFTTKAEGKGTGLGLSQVYRFVIESGGHIRIESAPGEGTCVTIWLPRVMADVTAFHDETPLPDIPGATAREVVLVVDDEPAVRRFSSDALLELGYRVLDADGAVKALKLIDAHPEIALLFTDIVMPETNGRKLAQAARILRPGLKVLFTSGYPRDALVGSDGDNDIQLLSKPFTIEQLATRVRDVLDA